MRFFKYKYRKMKLNESLSKAIDYGNNQIKNKNGKSDATTVRDVLDNISTIPEGGSASGWKPNPTWWDVDTILKEDTEDVGVGGKAIILLAYYGDVSEDTITVRFNNFYKIKTSDGQEFVKGDNLSVNITWDKSKDKLCDFGYSTRYLIFYSNNLNKTLFRTLISLDVQKLVLGYILDSLVTNNMLEITFASTVDMNYYSSNLVFAKYPNCTGDIRDLYEAFKYKRFLEYCELSKLWDIVNMGYIFYGCVSLVEFKLPEITTNITSFYSSFYNCVKITQCTLNCLFDFLEKCKKLTNIGFMMSNVKCKFLRLNLNLPGINQLLVYSILNGNLDCKEISLNILPSNIVSIDNFLVTQYTMSINIHKLFDSFTNNNLNALNNSIALRYFESDPDTILKYSLNLGSSSLLRKESALNLFNVLSDNTGTSEVKGLALHVNVKAKLLPEDIAIATSKNWTIL